MSIIENFSDFLGGDQAFYRDKWSINVDQLAGEQKHNVQRPRLQNFSLYDNSNYKIRSTDCALLVKLHLQKHN